MTRRFDPLLILLALILTGCALPGLGARPFSAATPASGPRTAEPAPQTAAVATSLPAPAASSTSQPTVGSHETRVPPAASPPPASPGPSTQRTPAVFSLPAWQPAPAGILPQVNILQTGGGSGYNGSDCESKPGEPRWCRPFDGASLPLTAEFRGVACGLGSQPVRAMLLGPDGATQPLQVQGEPPFCREISYRSNPLTVPGRYQVRVEQTGITLTDTFEYVRPDRPQGVQLQGCAWLAGLAPNQSLPFLVFGLSAPDSESEPLLATWRYLAAISLPASADGMLWACPDPAIQAAYPELAYLANLPAGALPLGPEDLIHSFQGACSAGPVTRLALGARFVVLDKGMPIFPDPGLDGSLVGSLEAGSQGTILGGPVCPPEGPWTWKASFENGLTGWIAESDAAGYFVEPVR